MTFETFFSHQTPKNYRCGKHSHNFWEIVLIKGTHGWVEIDGKHLPFADGDLHVVAPFSPHIWHGNRKAVHFCLGLSGPELRNFKEGNFTVDGRMAEFFLRLCDEVNQQEEFFQVVAELIAKEIYFLLKRYFHQLDGANKEREGPGVGESIRGLIDRGYSRHVDLTQLSESLFLSKDYIRHSFKREYGVSPIQYLIQKRIDAAKLLLTETTHSIKEISFECGFETPNYFSRVFKKFTRLTPTVYRNSTKKEAARA